MESRAIATRTPGAVALAALCLLLAACMFAPGKFAAELDLRRDGAFTFAYQGEIHVLGLSDLAAEGRATPDFAPSPCYDDEGAEKSCGKEEIASQKAEWQAARDRAESRRKRDSARLSGMMGGIDPSDPRAAQDLADLLRRQAGYRSVEYKGNGVYLVDYRVVSRLTHDFMFPSLEGFPMTNAFVQISRRQGGEARIDAPGFAAHPLNDPAGAMLAGSLAGDGEGPGPRLPQIDGRFTITTDGEVLANNTDAGGRAGPDGRRLEWTINSRSKAPPMALIRIDP